MKKGRHRRFEEARALKRSDNVDFDGLLDEFSGDDDDDGYKPEHDAWADMAETVSPVGQSDAGHDDLEESEAETA